MTYLEKVLKKQFDRVIRLGWLDYFQDAARLYDIPVERLIAIGSRETNLDPKYLTELGDNDNGYGIMQIDKRSYPAWCSSGAWRDARKGILKGAEVLSSKRAYIKSNIGRVLRVQDSRTKQFYKFEMPRLTGENLERAAISSYNGGGWPLYHYTRGRGFDRGTTGANYSEDVLARAEIFKKLLAGYVAAQETSTRQAKAPMLATGDNADSPGVESNIAKVLTGESADSGPTAPSGTIADDSNYADTGVIAEPAEAMRAGVMPSNLKTAARSFGQFLFGGWKRIVAWIGGMGWGLDAGILPGWAVLLIVAVLIGAAVWWYCKRKGRSK